MLRLHDAGTQWANMDPGGGNPYQFDNLDQWLDQIAAHEPRYVIQVFTWVPCWDAPTCSSPPTAPLGTNAPPNDLGAGGSTAFNNFVTAFTQHCNSNNVCVKDVIKYYEMWNEWDLQFHWTGTMAQVYQMVAPAAAIIRTNVPNAVILTPSATPSSDTGLGYQKDFQNWLNYETQNGKISDWIAWHVYLTATTNNQTQIDIPEAQWTNFNQNFLNIEQSTAGWANTPWANTETNFNGSPPPGLNFTCPTSATPAPPVTYSAQDCAGMIVRWQILHDSNGAASLDWYKWNETIGNNPAYEPLYYQMMQYLIGTGGKPTFTAPASSSDGQTWTAPFTEANGTSALWVWSVSEASGLTYMPPAGSTYSNVHDLAGNATPLLSGQPVTISTQPVMLD